MTKSDPESFNWQIAHSDGTSNVELWQSYPRIKGSAFSYKQMAESPNNAGPFAILTVRNRLDGLGVSDAEVNTFRADNGLNKVAPNADPQTYGLSKAPPDSPQTGSKGPTR